VSVSNMCHVGIRCNVLLSNMQICAKMARIANVT
jgi:hypothetical protein